MCGGAEVEVLGAGGFPDEARACVEMLQKIGRAGLVSTEYCQRRRNMLHEVWTSASKNRAPRELLGKGCMEFFSRSLALLRGEVAAQFCLYSSLLLRQRLVCGRGPGK